MFTFYVDDAKWSSFDIYVAFVVMQTQFSYF